MLSSTIPLKGSAVFTQSTQMAQAPLMSIVTKLLPVVVSRRVPNPKPFILNMNSLARSYPQIYSKHALGFVLCQTVYFVQSEPKFTEQVTEAIFVVIPGAVKINGAVHSLLKDCPSPTGSSLVTIDIKGT